MSRSSIALVWVVLLLAVIGPAHAADAGADVARLEQEVERAESLRAVKNLTMVYSQYAQAGRWRDMARLFSRSGELVHGDERASGTDGIHQLVRKIHGSGRDGLPDGAFNVRLISTPVAILSADGETATARFQDFGIHGRYGGDAAWSGGIHENRYVREGGVWKFATLHYHPVLGGDYEDGWRSLTPTSPVIPYSFGPKEAGEPLTANPAYRSVEPVEPPRIDARLASLERRIGAMVDGDKVLNLQAAYGYYLDRKMWDDVADLFTADAVIEDVPVGVYQGVAGVRRWLATMGKAGLARGEANDRPQFGVVVRMEPNGIEARTRGIQMTMLGSAETGEASLGFQVLEGRFVKQGGVWRIREMRSFPVIDTDYYQGFAKHRRPAPMPAADARPDRASRASAKSELLPDPVTGRSVVLTGARSERSADIETRLREARRGLRVALAYHGAENVTNAFSYWLDDFAWDKASALFHAKGWRGKYMVGFYEGPDHILAAETAMYGATSATRTGAALHYRPQPLIDVNEDGTQAKVRARLINVQHRWSGEPSGFMTGMYPNDGAILDNGTWKTWAIAIDEPYIASDGWKRGWARPRPPQPVDPNAPPLGTTGIFKKMTDVIKPDMPIARLKLRERGFVPGDLILWPDIKPMWFHYRNPVSGREPPNYCADLHTCEAELEWAAARQLPVAR
ncbi:MAG: nuclear transport factor 2 family protein [Steroidobacteraceae bacterium]